MCDLVWRDYDYPAGALSLSRPAIEGFLVLECESVDQTEDALNRRAAGIESPYCGLALS